MWKLKGKESFLFIKEEFDSGSNSFSEDKSEYSPNVVTIDNNRSEDELEENKTIFSIQKVESSSNECYMQ